MRPGLAILGIAVLLLTGCGGKVTSAPKATPISHPKTFTSRAYRFSLTYDASQLTQTPSGLNDAKHGLLVVDFIKKDLGGIEVTAVRETRNVGASAVHKLLRAALAYMDMPVAQRRAVKPASVGGLLGLEVQGSSEGSTVEVFAVGHGHYVYTIMIGADVKAWNTLRPTLEAAEQTFRFLQ